MSTSKDLRFAIAARLSSPKSDLRLTGEFKSQIANQKSQIFFRKSLATGAIHLLLVGIAFTMVLPFVWMALTSLKTLPEVGLADWLPRGCHSARRERAWVL